MAFNINHITLVGGNLTRDAELKTTNTGKHVFNFDIGMNRSIKNQDGTRTDVPEFFKIVWWCDWADKVAHLLMKGQKVAIEGRLSQRKYEKDGQTRYIVEVVASNVMLIGAKSSTGVDEIPQSNSAPQANPYGGGMDTSPMEDGDVPF